ncbi:hypothetical protein [Archaeoglobus sp.]
MLKNRFKKISKFDKTENADGKKLISFDSQGRLYVPAFIRRFFRNCHFHLIVEGRRLIFTPVGVNNESTFDRFTFLKSEQIFNFMTSEKELKYLGRRKLVKHSRSYYVCVPQEWGTSIFADVFMADEDTLIVKRVCKEEVG